MAHRPPLLLIPGLLLNADLWADQILALADLAAPIVTTAQTEHSSMAAIASAILAGAPPRFMLAGMSMGGYVAQEIVAQAPDRVQRLALIDTSARPDSPEIRAQRAALIRQSGKGTFVGISRPTFAQWVHSGRAKDEALFARVAAMTRSVGRDAFVRQQTAIIDRPDYRPGLARIACQTAILCGDADRVTPPDHAKEMADAIPSAALTVIPECGHVSPLEQSAAVSAALRLWLAT